MRDDEPSIEMEVAGEKYKYFANVNNESKC